MTLVPSQVLMDFRGSRVDQDMDLLVALLPKSIARHQRHTGTSESRVQLNALSGLGKLN